MRAAVWVAAVWVALLGLAGCASGAQRDRALAAACAERPDHDARCVGVLTGEGEGPEAAPELAAADAAREAEDFNARLVRLRREEEARQVARGRPGAVPTSTAAGASEALELPPPTWDVAAETTGSSIRALKAAPPAEPRAEPRAEPPARVTALPTRSAPRAIAPGATPEQYYRAALCLLEADELVLRGAAGAREARTLALVDVGRLALRVRQEAQQRGLAKEGTLCTSSEVWPWVKTLRAILGAPPESEAAVADYGGGLEALARELETRAGLSRPQ